MDGRICNQSSNEFGGIISSAKQLESFRENAPRGTKRPCMDAVERIPTLKLDSQLKYKSEIKRTKWEFTVV